MPRSNAVNYRKSVVVQTHCTATQSGSPRHHQGRQSRWPCRAGRRPCLGLRWEAAAFALANGVGCSGEVVGWHWRSHGDGLRQLPRGCTVARVDCGRHQSRSSETDPSSFSIKFNNGKNWGWFRGGVGFEVCAKGGGFDDLLRWSEDALSKKRRVGAGHQEWLKCRQ
jgi:hypothetical protein